MLPASEVHFMNEELYDHCPYVITWEGGLQNGRKQFIYYNIWRMAIKFNERVVNSWYPKIEGRKMYQLIGEMNKLKKVLMALNKEIFSEVEQQEEREKETLYKSRDKIQRDPRNAQLIEEEIQLIQ